ncbi:hypothetical protein [Cytobacillus sp.]|uniref:hypothetical protein n=1 Tax=Cytobacillus sp. TaxID=2675269 RepID=UPI0028BEB80E|nr:hypothetical protein [Cytobacillus sp.]
MKGREVVILLFNRVELATLVLHMNIMRHNIKKGFKSNYGRSEGKEKLNVYDGIKERLGSDLEGEEKGFYEFEIDEVEMNMLHSFLNWYVEEIKLSAEDQGADIEKDEQIKILDRLSVKISNIIEMAIEKA